MQRRPHQRPQKLLVLRQNGFDVVASRELDASGRLSEAPAIDRTGQQASPVALRRVGIDGAARRVQPVSTYVLRTLWGRLRHPLLEGVDERFCGPQVDGVEALGKPVVDRLEERHRVGGTALIAQ